MSVFKGKTPIFLSLALGSLLLSGCGHISKNFVSEADMVDKAELATGVDSSRLSVVPGSVKAELDSIHFKVKSKGARPGIATSRPPLRFRRMPFARR